MIEAQDLKRMLPEWYEMLYETDLLMRVEQNLFDDLAMQIKRSQSNQYVSTADSETLSIYENMLHITRQPGDTLSMRRFRILSRLSTQKPYTERYLKEVLLSFGSPVTFQNIYDEYRLIIESNFEQQGQMSDLDYMIRTIVPASLVVNVNNHLALNSLNEKIYLGEAFSVGEFVVITQDFRESESIGKVLQVGGVISNAQHNAITADFRASLITTQNSKMAVANTVGIDAVLTQDFNASESMENITKQSAGVVSADFITFNKESE